MTLEQLRIFVAVAERSHVTRAAEALNLTQSAASAAVAALEGRYGVKLFDRVGRGLVLSAAGRAFLPEAKAVLAREVEAARVLDDLAGLRRGVLSIIASQTVASYWLPPRLTAFRAAYPAIEVRLQAGNTSEATDKVLQGEAELAIVEGATEGAALERLVVGGDRLVLAAAPGHALATRARLEAPDLAAASWAMREPGSGTRSAVHAALAALGLKPEALRVAFEAPSNEAALSAAAAGDVLCAVSELAAEPMLRAGLLVRLPLDFPARPFTLVTPKGRPSRAAEAFCDSLAAPAATGHSRGSGHAASVPANAA